jgi:hypothetical protein
VFATGARPVVGAFYRIHETRTAISGFAGCAGDRCCELDGTPQQIGCLVGASPCSIGIADSLGAIQEVSTLADGSTSVSPQSVYAASLNGVEHATGCFGSYPLSRAVWLSTMLGFRPGGVSGDELELARCFSGNGLNNGLTIQQMAAAEGFFPVPIGCRSFDESVTACGDGGPTNSCANNPEGVASLLAVGEACTAAGECATNACSSGKCAL